jgi:hypothetical protein
VSTEARRIQIGQLGLKKWSDQADYSSGRSPLCGKPVALLAGKPSHFPSRLRRCAKAIENLTLKRNSFR